jgi:hypothetical protein
MGAREILGSDISAEMVEATTQSLTDFIDEEKMWQERIKKVGGTPKKDFSLLNYSVRKMDARKIDRDFFANIRNKEIVIVSEGYLGEIMSPRDISLDRVQSERRKLAIMYEDFFSEIANAKICNNIIMSFPFWNLHGTYSYFTEIYSVIEKYGFSIAPLVPSELGLSTKK